VTDEIFGPVVVATKFTDIDEVIATGNDTPYGLSAGIWTSDVVQGAPSGRADAGGHRVGELLQRARRRAAFGGFKQSGWGREHGHEVLDAYTRQSPW